MSDIVEGIGGAIEGALAGRAVEPARGEAGDGDQETANCPNCGATGNSAYCSECGQKRQVHRTLSAIFHDLIHGVLHLDGKFWKTLPLLTFRPGQLTRRYIEGERAKFVSPMAMFLFTVFAMFAIFQMAGLSVSNLGLDDPRRVWDVDAARGDLSENLDEARKESAELEARIAEAEGSGVGATELSAMQVEMSELDRRIENYEEGLEALNQIPLGSSTSAEEGVGEVAAGAGQQESTDESSDFTFSGTGIESIDGGLIKKWQENPSLMLYKLQANAYKFSWLLIPLSIPFVWLLFAWRREFRAYDHAVFITYSLAFMSLLFITLSLLTIAGIGGGWLFLTLLVVPPIHLYKQLRGTYRLGRFSAIWRLLLLSQFIWIVIALFLQALLFLGAF
ncbi:DUF3667 domain-containing protein [uncultured Erythrobacter sp.]|uniref:DUF3667 domain-containing protein n=1 Tax=uncultured Erythrobacter sp. TaxID=263913 RepID=UPI00262057FD|nr:DUF3667 domain-containing protein [uncultured Erythrobacter sp.]